MADRHVRNPDAALSGAAKAHYPALQSARGLAAIAVLTCHSLLVFETSGGIHALARITEPLAHVAVVFFFVLSGFVLTDRKSTRLNSRHYCAPRMPSSSLN